LRSSTLLPYTTLFRSGAQLRQRGGHVQARVGDEGLGCGLHRLLVARGEGAQRVLEAVAELAEDVGRHIVWELRAEIHAHALGARSEEHTSELQSRENL